MGNGSERVPVSAVSVSKRPKNPGARQTRDDMRVFVNVDWVVVINELVMQCLPEHDPGEADQDDADRRQQGTVKGRCFLLFHAGSGQHDGMFAFHGC